jgi:hypothetical protein
MLSKNDVFLSYRRADGNQIAHVLRQALERRGYSVFLDVTTMRSGPFDKLLERAIKKTSDFVPLLTDKAVAVKERDDWFFEEVKLAFQHRKRICPLVVHESALKTISDPDHPLAQLASQHAVTYSHEHCEATIDKLCQFLSKAPSQRQFGLRLFFGFGEKRWNIVIGFSLLCLFLAAIGVFDLLKIRLAAHRNSETNQVPGQRIFAGLSNISAPSIISNAPRSIINAIPSTKGGATNAIPPKVIAVPSHMSKPLSESKDEAGFLLKIWSHQDRVTHDLETVERSRAELGEVGTRLEKHLLAMQSALDEIESLFSDYLDSEEELLNTLAGMSGGFLVSSKSLRKLETDSKLRSQQLNEQIDLYNSHVVEIWRLEPAAEKTSKDK